MLLVFLQNKEADTCSCCDALHKKAVLESFAPSPWLRRNNGDFCAGRIAAARAAKSRTVRASAESGDHVTIAQTITRATPAMRLTGGGNWLSSMAPNGDKFYDTDQYPAFYGHGFLVDYRTNYQ